ncbi:hypothetical protein O9992_27865 [Vibrio lentus]|nr:hypothetical protein [Vibrio lentus]
MKNQATTFRSRAPENGIIEANVTMKWGGAGSRGKKFLPIQVVALYQ